MEYTTNEIRILKIFWKSDKSLTKNDLLKMNTDNSWRTNTIYHLLNNLLSKGAIREDGYTRSGNVIIRKYRSVFSYNDYCLQLLNPIIQELDFENFAYNVLCKCDDIEILEKIKKFLIQKNSKNFTIN